MNPKLRSGMKIQDIKSGARGVLGEYEREGFWKAVSNSGTAVIVHEDDIEELHISIYLASSWRNVAQPMVLNDLRSQGYNVYDFRHPIEGDNGFSWKQCTESPQPWTAAEMVRVLQHPVAQHGFNLDMTALKNCDACVLLLPCGRSAHLELGYATGAGKKTFVLLDDPISEPELMYLMNTKICTSLAELEQALNLVEW